MGSSATSPRFFKSWLYFLLRLLSLPAALLTFYLECYGTSPTATSLILLRLSRRLRLKTFVLRKLKQDHDMIAAAMDRAQSPHKPSLLSRKRSMTLQETSGANQQRLSRHLSTASASDASFPAMLPSPSSSSSSSSIPNKPHHARARTMSHTDIVRQGKRLSLQFPIQPSAAGSASSPAFSPRARPQSWMAAPSPLLSPESTSSSSSSPGSILAVLAAQERYVLELREELGKAEEDLKTLKKHYAQHEATKRRNDGRRISQLQPLNTSLANSPGDDTDDDTPGISMQREMERRRALLNNTRHPQRKVFSGSRHLRTLSLLSPDRSHAPIFPQPIDLLSDEPLPRSRRPSPPARTLTSETTSRQLIDVAHSPRHDANPMPAIQRENIIRAGKQMASDFSNGLFTFIEDIRQATVGDEAVNGSADHSGPSHNRGPYAKSSRNSSGSRPPLNRSASSRKQSQGTGSIGEDFWSEHGLGEPKSTPVNKKTHTVKPVQTPQSQLQGTDTEFEDDWDWDTAAKTTGTHDGGDDSDDEDAPDGNRTITSASYHAKRHDSKNSSVATISSASMPDKSGSRDPKRNSLPWSDLSGLSPSNLKRTASHLMKEWEKQLTPPPESRLSSHSHGDFIGRTGSPAGLS
jgi:hypothetical protein